ncbi:MAG: hypothetical protein L0323_14275 [Planctomycetes bacterium]|nr:hypothetical protein [Planctomycetota bacterium]
MNPFADRRGLAEFFLDWVEAAGGAVERESEDLFAVLAPGALPSVRGSLVRVSPDPALAREEGALLLAPGSALFEELFGAATARGRLARAWLAGADLDPRAARSAIERSLSLAGLALALAPEGARWVPTLVFRFRVLYESEAREEESMRIAVDGRTGRLARNLQAEFPSVVEHPFAQFPRMEPIDVRALHRSAVEELERRIGPAANRRRREREARIGRERARTERYFESMLEELGERAARRPSADPSFADSRRRAILAERDRALAEVSGRDPLRVSHRLVGLLRLEVPKTFFRLRLTPARGGGAGLAPAEVEVAFDPLAGAVEPPSCPRCGVATLGFRARRGMGVVCERCGEGDARGARRGGSLPGPLHRAGPAPG